LKLQVSSGHPTQKGTYLLPGCQVIPVVDVGVQLGRLQKHFVLGDTREDDGRGPAPNNPTGFSLTITCALKQSVGRELSLFEAALDRAETFEELKTVASSE
jgi:hypothetical protein